MSNGRRRILLAVSLACALMSSASAQDLEPRRWTHLPIGMNVVGAGYVYTEGDLRLDPLLEIEDVKFESHLAALSLVHSFEFLGKTSRVDLLVPYQEADWTGTLSGVPAVAGREGLADPRLRFSMNLVGAPPLKGKEYMGYCAARPVHTTLGVGLAVTLPLGEYKQDKLLNLGNNRFSFRPQLGLLHTRGPWSYELTGSMYLFTDNDEFLETSKLERKPIYALQAHVVRTLKQGWWIAAGAGFGAGGESKVDGVSKGDRKGDLLTGASFGFPLTKTQGIKFAYLATRTQEGVGADSDSFIVGWSMRF